MKKLFAVAALLSLFAIPVHASTVANDAPLLSLTRLAVGAGVNEEFYTNHVEGAMDRQWTAGLYAAYALTASPSEQRIPRLNLIGSTEYGVTDKITRWKLGLRVTLFDGGK